MRIICAPQNFDFKSINADYQVELYSITEQRGSVGYSIFKTIESKNLNLTPRVWDLLSISLAVVASDLYAIRDCSPDGWTRELDLTIAVNDPSFWNSEKELLEDQLRFLSTDIWNFNFIDSGFMPSKPKSITYPNEDCVTLLSGGLDSFIGAIDLKHEGLDPYAVSQIVRGDAEKQKTFAQDIGSGIKLIQFNHNASVSRLDKSPPTQRTRSIIFLTYGVIMATCLKKYLDSKEVILYMSENGFISINPPLTGSRIGSLSTRTTNPIFLDLFQALLNKAGINVSIKNKYQFKTKGEMLLDCKDQDYLIANAHKTTSCGRFGVHKLTHCGRCVPCLVRRSAFKKWGIKDETKYVYHDLSVKDQNHAYYDDVRSAGIAISKMKSEGLHSFLGTSLNSSIIGDVKDYENVAKRGILELELFLNDFNIS